jgi:peptide/nickel transport system permease protein
LIALVVGIGLGIAAATWPGGLLDQAVRIFATLGASQALFWLALVNVHVFYYILRIAPAPMDRLAIGLQPPPFVSGLLVFDSLLAGNTKVFVDAVRHLALPAITLAFVVSAPIVKMTRAAMMDTLHSEFIRTARAIGVPAREVILRDGLRNAFIPILTMLGIVFGYLIAGNVVVEKVFSWSGIGQYAWNALVTADYDAMQGFVLLIAVVYVTLNLLIDLAYGFVNPKIRLG